MDTSSLLQRLAKSFCACTLLLVCPLMWAAESNTSKIFDINTFQLSNGIPVITHQKTDNDLFSIQLVVEVGLQDFPCEDRHLPHVLEHVLFEETKTFDGEAFRKRVYDKGGYWQGFTSDEYTHYTINIHKLFSNIAVDTLYRMVSEPTLSDKATQNAIRTVNTEMGTSAQGLLQNWLADTLSIKEQGKNRLYPDTNIACDKRQTPNHLVGNDVRRIFEGHYVPDNFTLVVIGEFEETQIKQLLEDSFGQLPQKDASPRIPLKENPIDYTPIEETEKYGDPSTYLKLFVRAEGKSKPASLVWELISLYLTEQTFTQIRTKRGIGYSPRAIYDAGTDAGHIEISVRTTSDWYDEVHAIALDIYNRLLADGIPEEEIERLKNRMLYIFESTERQNMHLFQLYRHNRASITESGTMRNLVEEIKQIDSLAVKQVLDRFPEKPLVAVLRPNSFMEAVLKVIGIVAIAALIALPILRRKRKQ